MKNIQFLCILFLIIISAACQRKITAVSSTDTRDSIPELQVVAADTLKDKPSVIQEPTEEVLIKVHRVLPDTVTVIGVGDIMMGTNFPNDSYLPPNDGRDLFEEVKEVLNSANVTFGNLEGVIKDEGGDQKHCRDPKVCYIFRSPERYVSNLVDAGFTVMSLANNHAGDFGEPGRKSTMQVLDSAGIYYAGLTACPFVIFKKDGLKYGFTAFAPNYGTMSLHDHKGAQAIVAHMDSLVDIVIVSFHGGAEGPNYEHITRKSETFVGENRGNVYQFAHDMIDAGADIIFGHGPHVTRAVEVYKNRFIAYSLGNFCTYARFNLSGVNGLAPVIKVFTDAEGKFLKGEITPIIQYPPGGPRIDSQNRVIKKLQQLTEKDFPEVPLTIDDSGIITYIEIEN